MPTPMEISSPPRRIAASNHPPLTLDDKPPYLPPVVLHGSVRSPIALDHMRQSDDWIAAIKPKMLLRIRNWLRIRLRIRPPIIKCPLLPRSALGNANLTTPRRPETQRVALADRMRLSMETNIDKLNNSPRLELPAGSSIAEDIDIAARLVLRVDKVRSMQKEALCRIFNVDNPLHN